MFLIGDGTTWVNLNPDVVYLATGARVNLRVGPFVPDRLKILVTWVLGPRVNLRLIRLRIDKVFRP